MPASVNAPMTDAAPVDTTGVGPTSSDEDFWDGIDNIGRSLRSTASDVASYTGVLETTDNGPASNVMNIGGFAAVTAGPVALAALVRSSVDPLTRATRSYPQRLGATAATTGIKITPTLVSAVLGPAIADGATMLLPNLLPKYKDVSKMPTAKPEEKEAKSAQEKANQKAKIGRAIAGGVIVGVAAAITFLVKPDIFKKFGSGLADAQASGKSLQHFMNSEAVEGVTHYVSSNGVTGKIQGVLNAEQIGGALAAVNRGGVSGETYTIVKQIAGMTRDAAFSNRFVTASIGGIATAMLANKAAGEQGEDGNKWWIAAGVAGAATIGATYGVGKLTERAVLSEVGKTVANVGGKQKVLRGVLDAEGVRSALAPTRDALTAAQAVEIVSTAAGDGMRRGIAKNRIMFKPNLAWIKSYGKIAGITAVPAGTAASQYFNIVSDFNDITSAKSPFRK